MVRHVADIDAGGGDGCQLVDRLELLTDVRLAEGDEEVLLRLGDGRREPDAQIRRDEVHEAEPYERLSDVDDRLQRGWIDGRT